VEEIIRGARRLQTLLGAGPELQQAPAAKRTQGSLERGSSSGVRARGMPLSLHKTQGTNCA
jgi:hypothetical protein